MRKNIREIDDNVDNLLKNVHCQLRPPQPCLCSLLLSPTPCVCSQREASFWCLCVPSNETVLSMVGFNDI